MRLIMSLGVLAFALMSCSCPQLAPVAVEDRQTTQLQSEVSRLVTYPRFGDSDPVEWDGRGPRAYPIHGIDASRWQEEIDWRKARRTGVSFAFFKATEGGDFADPRFKDHMQGARSAGIPWGAYHYYYFCRSAEEQARWFIQNVPRGSDLPHVLDMESTPHSKTCTKRPSGAKVRSEARKFLATLQAHYDRRPIIYTTVDFYQDTGIGQVGSTEFWLRSVAGLPRKVYPGGRWTFWQYTGTGQVPGVAGDMDINVFGGSPEAWVKWRDRIGG